MENSMVVTKFIEQNEYLVVTKKKRRGKCGHDKIYRKAKIWVVT